MPNVLSSISLTSQVSRTLLIKKNEPDFESTSIISKMEGIWNRVILESTFICLESHAVNRDTCFNLSVSWGLALHLIGSQAAAIHCELKTSGRFWNAQETALNNLLSTSRCVLFVSESP